MAKPKEIEIQVQIEKSAKLFKFLETQAQFIGQERQIDTYFSPAHKNFIEVRPIREWLRLRKSGKKHSINYKNWHYDNDGKSHYCDEYESPVESLTQVKNIFKALNMKKVVTVDKTRKIYLYKDYEISIDSIKDLGDFVEIEYKGKAKNVNPSEITKDMITFLRQFNPGKISKNYVGYPFMLMFPKETEIEVL